MGASGYTGGELLRMLLNHPNVEIQQIIGNESAGKNISNIFSNFIDTNLPKIKTLRDSNLEEVEVLFHVLQAASYQKLLKTYQNY